MRKAIFKVTGACLTGLMVCILSSLPAFGGVVFPLPHEYYAGIQPMTLDRGYVESRMDAFLDELSQGADLNKACTPVFDAASFISEVQRVGVFDVGSTGIRLLAADVNLSSGVVTPLCSFEYSLPFGLSEADSQQRLAAIAAMKDIVEDKYCMPQGIEFRAVATAGFRAAGEQGVALAQEIEHTTGVSFDVINQEREGILAFLGANLQYPDADASNVVVWDIGGGSMQITTMGEGDELIMAGCEIAARTFLKEMLAHVKGDVLATPNPVAPHEVDASITLAKDLLNGTAEKVSLKPFDENQFKFIQRRIQSQDYVLGVGGVHARIVVPSIHAMMGMDVSSYTPELLWETIQRMIDCKLTDAGILELMDVAEDSVNSIVTSLLLVYATMELLDIHHVHVLDINNTQGLVAEYLTKSVK